MSMETTAQARPAASPFTGRRAGGAWRAYDLRVVTRGGVYDLGRVVSVMALLEITPTALTSHGDAGGLRIEARLEGEARACELCISRLNALVCVKEAALTAARE